METIEELGEKFLKRFEKLRPMVCLRESGVVLFSLRLHDVFRVLVNPVAVLLSDYESIENAFEHDPNWLDGHIYQSLSVDARSGLMLFVVGNAGRESRIRSRLENQIVSLGQPLIPASAFFARNKSPNESIRDVIVQHLEVTHFSPYRIDKVADKTMFYGRYHVLNNLLTSKGSKVIFGPRRIGKSSLARHLQQILGKVDRTRQGETPMLKCSYVDVSELGSDASLRIWNSILKNFNLRREDFAPRGRISKLVGTRKDLRSAPTDEAQALASSILAYNGQLTIILDEVDKWIEFEAPIGWPTLERLRAMSDDGKAQILLIGYESLALASEHDRFPFAGRGSQLLLGPLDKNDVLHLVTEPSTELGLRFIKQSEIVNLVWTTTSGMPHVVQDICARMVRLALNKSSEGNVTTDLVKTAIDSADTVGTLRNSVIHCGFPLAEAIAGILSLGVKATDDGEDGTQRTKIQMTNDEILSELEATEFGVEKYVYDARDFERALAYLEIRFVLQATDEERTQWMWRNAGSRKKMRETIKKTGKERWLRNLLAQHYEGSWRKRYQFLETKQ